MQTRSSTGFNAIPENVAAVVFSHLGDDPRDRVRLAAVSKVWRDAEKSDASLPGGSPSALFELGEGLYAAYEYKRAIYWWRRATGDADAMYWIGRLLQLWVRREGRLHEGGRVVGKSVRVRARRSDPPARA